MRKILASLLCGSVLVLPLALLLRQAKAIPRYSTRYEQNCNLCHVNPTGGGMRSLYASQYLVPEEIATRAPQEELLAAINPEITTNVTIGADFRTMYFHTNDDEQIENFFQMQGDLYIAFQMDRLSLYYDRGMSQSHELFGLAYILPGDGYVKVGRFVPAYGIKFQDHTMFTRQYLGFIPPVDADTGVELGSYPGGFAFQLAVLNGAPGSLYDDNSQLAAAARAAYRFRLAGVGVMVGGSGRYNPRNELTENDAGAIASLMLGRLIWLGEFDWRRTKPQGEDATTALVTSHQFTYQLHKGIALMATFDFYDPDSKYQTGNRRRYGGGIFLFPNPFVNLEALVRAYDSTTGIAISENDYIETVLQLHILY